MHVISKLECADYIRLIEQFNNLETEIITKLSMSQDIVVCKIGKSENHGLIPSRGKTIFLLSKACRPALGSTEPPIQWALGALFPGVKQSECEVDNSLPFRTDVELYLTSPWFAQAHFSLHVFLCLLIAYYHDVMVT